MFTLWRRSIIGPKSPRKLTVGQIIHIYRVKTQCWHAVSITMRSTKGHPTSSFQNTPIYSQLEMFYNVFFQTKIVSFKSNVPTRGQCCKPGIHFIDVYESPCPIFWPLVWHNQAMYTTHAQLDICSRVNTSIKLVKGLQQWGWFRLERVWMYKLFYIWKNIYRSDASQNQNL